MYEKKKTSRDETLSDSSFKPKTDAAVQTETESNTGRSGVAGKSIDEDESLKSDETRGTEDDSQESMRSSYRDSEESYAESMKSKCRYSEESCRDNCKKNDDYYKLNMKSKCRINDDGCRENIRKPCRASVDNCRENEKRKCREVDECPRDAGRNRCREPDDGCREPPKIQRCRGSDDSRDSDDGCREIPRNSRCRGSNESRDSDDFCREPPRTSRCRSSDESYKEPPKNNRCRYSDESCRETIRSKCREPEDSCRESVRSRCREPDDCCRESVRSKCREPDDCCKESKCREPDDCCRESVRSKCREPDDCCKEAPKCKMKDVDSMNTVKEDRCSEEKIRTIKWDFFDGDCFLCCRLNRDGKCDIPVKPQPTSCNTSCKDVYTNTSCGVLTPCQNRMSRRKDDCGAGSLGTGCPAFHDLGSHKTVSLEPSRDRCRKRTPVPSKCSLKEVCCKKEEKKEQKCCPDLEELARLKCELTNLQNEMCRLKECLRAAAAGEKCKANQCQTPKTKHHLRCNLPDITKLCEKLKNCNMLKVKVCQEDDCCKNRDSLKNNFDVLLRELNAVKCELERLKKC